MNSSLRSYGLIYPFINPATPKAEVEIAVRKDVSGNFYESLPQLLTVGEHITIVD